MIVHDLKFYLQTYYLHIVILCLIVYYIYYSHTISEFHDIVIVINTCTIYSKSIDRFKKKGKDILS